MPWSVCKQPDGKYAVFSSIVDSFLMVDATAQEVVDMYAEHAAANGERTGLQCVKRADGEAFPPPSYDFVTALAWSRFQAEGDPEEVTKMVTCLESKLTDDQRVEYLDLLRSLLASDCTATPEEVAQRQNLDTELFSECLQWREED